MNQSVYNRINKSGQYCCVNCSKSYKKRENLIKHLVLCDFLKTSKNKPFDEDDECVIPPPRIMYHLLIELGKKYNTLEEQMTEMTKWVSKKKKKINVIDWLNTNIAPTTTFDSFMTSNDWLTIIDTDIDNITTSRTFYDTINETFSRTLFVLENIPVFVFTQKANIIYVFLGQNNGDDENNGWIELSREKMVKWFNKIHIKFVKEFYSWEKIKRLKHGTNNDNFDIMISKTNIKLMNVDFRVENMFSKMRGVLFNGLKKDMKALVEYEFEF